MNPKHYIYRLVSIFNILLYFGILTHPIANHLPCRSISRATLVCAWAEYGADAMGPDGLLVHSDAVSPETVVDTLGAGDTFNAAVILALSKGKFWVLLIFL